MIPRGDLWPMMVTLLPHPMPPRTPSTSCFMPPEAPVRGAITSMKVSATWE